MWKRISYYFRRIYEIITTQEIRVLPGHLAYFFVLSVMPTLTLLGYISSIFGLSIEVIFEFFRDAFSEETANLLVPMISGKAIDFKLVMFILVGYGVASNGAHSIILASNRVYGIKDDHVIRRRVKALIMTFFIVMLFLFLLIVPVFGSTIINVIDSLNPNINIMQQVKSFLPYVKGPLTWFTIFFFIKIIYTLAPDKRIPSATVNKGAFFTTVMWSIVTYIYTYYATHLANYDIFYGALASIVMLMIWLYFLSYILVIGIVLNYGVDYRYNRKLEREREKQEQLELEEKILNNKEKTKKIK
ncbi:MAG: YihY/virulence factor BrkB family protein [Mollicutes bacterium]|nr:YihY/virulence factor BrkB family protein [Mollicutes bacterium]